MPAMNGIFSGWPYPLAVGVLFLIALARGNLTYWVGRAAAAGADRTRIRNLIGSAGFQRATRLINRWGPPVVSISFLTVGLQTLVNLAAGVSRMPLRRYLPAVTIGALLWGFLYGTVGFVTFAAWFKLYELSPVAAIVVLALLIAALIAFVVTQLRGQRSGASDRETQRATEETDEHAPDSTT
jgi:membrane protein DedA with SNARE-associated domain